MARIESESKGGFYATPVSQVGFIKSVIRGRWGSTVHLYDPCCGKGNTLKGLADTLKSQGVKAITYGIELEVDRANAAQKKLDYVLQSPYEDTRVTPCSMSFMWLNAPYTEHAGERAEVVFLRDITDPTSGKLQAGGLLGFCIPQKVLSSAATLLASRFENIQVYRFTDSEFSAYRQVVVFAYRTMGKRDYKEEKAKLKVLATSSDLPTLDKAKVLYIPPAASEVHTFLSNKLDPEEVKRILTASPLLENAKQHTPRKPRLMNPPVVNLKSSHIGVAIAAGAVGGNFGNHILVGATMRAVSTEETPTEYGTKRIEVHESKSIVRIFHPKGINVLK